jgi:uncharacterized protein
VPTPLPGVRSASCRAACGPERKGVGLFELPEPLMLVLFVAATVIGPMPIAFLMTGLTEGKPGVRRLLRRMVQWKVGVRWYLVVLLGFPLMFLVGYIPLVGTAPLTNLIQRWPLLFSADRSADICVHLALQ